MYECGARYPCIFSAIKIDEKFMCLCYRSFPINIFIIRHYNC